MSYQCIECNKKLKNNEVEKWSQNSYIYFEYCSECCNRMMNACNRRIKYSAFGLLVSGLSFLTYTYFFETSFYTPF